MNEIHFIFMILNNIIFDTDTHRKNIVTSNINTKSTLSHNDAIFTNN
jgi:hypothetical protein